MNKQPRNRLDDTLNAILIVVGLTALMTLAIDATRDDEALAQAPTRNVATKVAVQPTAPAATRVAVVQAPVAR